MPYLLPFWLWDVRAFVVFRGTGGSECMSDSASNDCAANDDDESAAAKQTSTDIGTARQERPTPASLASSAAGRRHDYHQLGLTIAGYDARCYTPSEHAAAAGYLPTVPLSCVPPSYFATAATRASVFQANRSPNVAESLYSMQQAWAKDDAGVPCGKRPCSQSIYLRLSQDQIRYRLRRDTEKKFTKKWKLKPR